ncbi:MAG: hypothetical protein WAZ15_09330 [Propioniciclava sp.]
MGTVTQVRTAHEAQALADVLNGDARKRPMVVVTIPAGKSEPWIDVQEIADQAGDLAEVYLMPTGAVSWAMAQRMPEGTEVYGGAGRVYPIGHEWLRDLTRSPLRFAWDARDRETATQLLVSDMFRMATAAGLVRVDPTTPQRTVDGVVTMVVSGRALVEVAPGVLASIAEELTVDGVPIERLVQVGQKVTGRHDPSAGRLDVRASLGRAETALSVYDVGNVVWARVVKVRPAAAELMLFPASRGAAVVVSVRREDVTGNPWDTLDLLLTVGEVVAARVVAPGPAWALTLIDVEDDEEVLPAPALLPGGPPWLVEDADEDTEPEPVPAPVRPQAPPPVAAEPSVAPAPLTQPRPTPKPGPPGRPRPAAAKPDSGALSQALLRIDALTAENRTLRSGIDARDESAAAKQMEHEQLRWLLDQAERRANRAEHDLKAAKVRLRKAGNARATTSPDEGPRFADREQGFRYLVTTQWATRTVVGEQAERPLPDYDLGPGFLASLDEVSGVTETKVADAVFEIVTGLAPQLNGREVHRLRSGMGGDDPIRTRADGAVAWRASLQVKTASARRIHYWALPNQRIELARIALHDDYDI